MPIKLPDGPQSFDALSLKVKKYGLGRRLNSSSFDVFGNPECINTPCDPMDEIGWLLDKIPTDSVSSVLTPVASRAPLFLAHRFNYSNINIADINPRQLESTWEPEYQKRLKHLQVNRFICDLAERNEFYKICQITSPDVLFWSNIFSFCKIEEEIALAKTLTENLGRKIPNILITGTKRSAQYFHGNLRDNGYNCEAIPSGQIWEARRYYIDS